jgi:hypothetical protein
MMPLLGKDGRLSSIAVIGNRAILLLNVATQLTYFTVFFETLSIDKILRFRGGRLFLRLTPSPFDS